MTKSHELNDEREVGQTMALMSTTCAHECECVLSFDSYPASPEWH